MSRLKPYKLLVKMGKAAQIVRVQPATGNDNANWKIDNPEVFGGYKVVYHSTKDGVRTDIKRKKPNAKITKYDG